MARPPAEGTKTRIREAAAELFARHGVGRTTVREIAKAANVNVAMVSHHFGGKEPLYEACLEAMYTELDGMQAELLAGLAEGGARQRDQGDPRLRAQALRLRGERPAEEGAGGHHAR